MFIKQKKEGSKEGRKEARKEGRKEARKEARKQGSKEGRKEGRKEFLHFSNPILYLTSVIKLYVQLISDNIYTAHPNIYTA